MKQSIGERLAQLRRKKAFEEARDVTQAMVAADLGVSVESYSRYENGKRPVPEKIIERIAAYFGTTEPFLRYGVGDEAVYLGPVPHEEAEAASRARAAKLAAQREAATPATPRKAAGAKRGRGNPRDGR